MFIKKTRFYVSIIMAVVTCFGLIGCAEKKPDEVEINPTNTDVATEEAYIPKETVTLSLFSDLSSFRGIQTGWFAEIMEEKFNVKLNIIMADNDNTDNRYDGTYDLIISGSCQGEAFQEAMSKGYFLDWNNYDIQKYMPYVSENLEGSYVRYSTESSEHIYGIYTNTSLPGDHTEIYYTWDMRYDYYEELGKPEIFDIDDWVAVLEQMKENHPVNDVSEEIYGISYHNEWDDGMLFGVQSFVCGYYGYEASGTGFYDPKSNKYYGTLAMEKDGSYGPYLRMLKLSNELYRKGLLNPASEAQDYNTAITEMVANGRVLSSLTSYSGSAINEKMYPVIPKEAHLLAYELGQISRRSISIDSETEYPELCMAIIDYFYSPEGMLTMHYGPKGECWDYDEAGLTYLTDWGITCLYERFTPRGELYFADGMPMFNISPYNVMAKNPDNGEPYSFEYWTNVPSDPSNAPEISNELEAAWSEWVGASSIEQYANSIDPYYIAPNTGIVYLSKTELSQQYEAVSDIIISKSWEAIKASTDEEFDRIVQDMISAANQAGYTECIEYCENYYQNVNK